MTVPIADHPQPLELAALDADPLLGEGAALPAQLQDRHRILALALLPVALFDLPFDWQAVTVPARNVVGILAEHLLGAVDNVFEDLVQRRADVQMAVGIGRPVVQHELRAPSRHLTQFPIEVKTPPARQNVRLPLRQFRLHGKVGARQEDGRLVIHELFPVQRGQAPAARARDKPAASTRRWRACAQSASICARKAARPSNFFSGRRNSTSSASIVRP